jgi:regulator of sigma E protease
VRRTVSMTQSTFAVLGRLLTGRASTDNVSGMITIAQVANAEADVGLGRLLAFMAALSLTLCIMNLLPIPVLDGGHLLYYLIELAARRPLSDRVLVAGQYVGLALLAGLISLAFYNDITRLFGHLAS